MEKSIKKWTTYGFLITLALAILFVDYTQTFDDSITSFTTYVPVYDYIVSIMRYSVLGAFGGMFVGVYVGWRLSKRTPGDKQ
ncbi:hypothetical protein ACIQXI_09990 [Lysinibacillus sp. NPDC097195]|uniref:hypothetical protein n=1 Tax=Lysinibacillus sp. NPDC097195 TaxID=3364141 RepID=UPI0038294DF5